MEDQGKDALSGHRSGHVGYGPAEIAESLDTEAAAHDLLTAVEGGKRRPHAAFIDRESYASDPQTTMANLKRARHLRWEGPLTVIDVDVLAPDAFTICVGVDNTEVAAAIIEYARSLGASVN